MTIRPINPVAAQAGQTLTACKSDHGFELLDTGGNVIAKIVPSSQGDYAFTITSGDLIIEEPYHIEDVLTLVPLATNCIRVSRNRQRIKHS